MFNRAFRGSFYAYVFICVYLARRKAHRQERRRKESKESVVSEKYEEVACVLVLVYAILCQSCITVCATGALPYVYHRVSSLSSLLSVSKSRSPNEGRFSNSFSSIHIISPKVRLVPLEALRRAQHDHV